MNECKKCGRNIKAPNGATYTYTTTVVGVNPNFFDVYPEFKHLNFMSGVYIHNTCMVCYLNFLGVDLKNMNVNNYYCSSCGRGMLKGSCLYSGATIGIVKSEPGFLDVYPEFKKIRGTVDPTSKEEIIIFEICHVCVLRGMGLDVTEMSNDPIIINIKP